MSDLHVTLVELPLMTVAYARAFGESPEAAAWEMLRAWAEPRGLLNDLAQHPVFGFNNPPPAKGKDEYGYEFWIRVDPEDMDEEDLAVKEFPGGLFATAATDLRHIGETWQNLWDWAQEHGHRWRKAHELEKHLNPLDPPDDLQLELFLPIEVARQEAHLST